jgi:hypothetical protein
MAMHALGQETTAASVAERLDVLRRRYQVLKDRLAQIRSPRITPFPFNSGSFALLGLDPVVPAEALRQRLLENSTGVVAVPSVNAIRIAYCSMDEALIPGLVDSIEQVVDSF